uniref:DNA/RNA-binding protein Alba-like domain-containing protein n=1 Tax=Romanomermis culicivorax TaxID=13658 RepID=A0A915KGS5_ROMCU
RVKKNAVLHNVVAYAERLLSDKEKPTDGILFVGVGPACSKAIACTEILKSRHKVSLNQVTRACYKRVEEYWEPMVDNLDRLKVNRDIPAIFLLLSENIIDDKLLGYQSPDDRCRFFNQDPPTNSSDKKTNFGSDASSTNIFKRKPKNNTNSSDQKRNRNQKKKGKSADDDS